VPWTNTKSGHRGGFGDRLLPRRRDDGRYLEVRTEREWDAERSDPDAEFAWKLCIDLGSLEPLISLPHSPGTVVALDEAKGRKVDQVYIGNCANGTMTDLRQTAEILRGREVHTDTRAIIVPASQKVYREAMSEGLLDLFVEAGAMVSTPTCGACFGGHMGVVAEGETAITTTNRATSRVAWVSRKRRYTSPTPTSRRQRRSRER
jgi:3-isopropylmalate/(R)-2-methylmalate dehydratase large subunit